MTEEEIELLIANHTGKVKLQKHNLITYLIYKIALERAYKNKYFAERNILVWNYIKKRRNSIS